MELLREIAVGSPDGTAGITLWHGDLTRLPRELAVDLLLVSAFPQSYAPMPGTLIGALDAAGLSVAALAANKAADLSATSGFWLSRPVGDAGLNIGRVLCFEHAPLGTPGALVGEIFRNLGPFLPSEGARVATALLATGNQGWPLDQTLPALVGAAREWMRRGLEIRELMIVEIDRARAEQAAAILDALDKTPDRATPARDPAPPPARGEGSRLPRGAVLALAALAAAALAWLMVYPGEVGDSPGGIGELAMFDLGIGTLAGAAVALAVAAAWLVRRMVARRRRQRIRDAFGRHMAPDVVEELARAERPYDVFISYTSKDKPAAEALAAAVREAWPEARLFDYRHEIEPGAFWQAKIDAAMERCGRVVAVLSPDYFASPECTEEIMMARLRNKREGGDVLLPVYWRSLDGDLALWLQIINFADCREGDAGRLRDFAGRLPPRRGA